MPNLPKPAFIGLLDYAMHVAAHQKAVERILEGLKVPKEDFNAAYSEEFEKLQRLLLDYHRNRYDAETGLPDTELSTLLQTLKKR